MGVWTHLQPAYSDVRKRQKMSLNFLSDHPVGPSFGFFQFVLGGVKDFLDAPAQRIKPGNHSRPQPQLGSEKLVADLSAGAASSLNFRHDPFSSSD